MRVIVPDMHPQCVRVYAKCKDVIRKEKKHLKPDKMYRCFEDKSDLW